MSDEQKAEEALAWERQPGEKLLWYGRFQRYLQSWPHSIPQVYREELAATQEAEQDEKQRDSTAAEPPGAWYRVAREWQWQDRAVAYDEAILDEMAETAKAERARVYLSGLALSHKRIEVLASLAEKLIELTGKDEAIWIDDVRNVGGEAVPIKHFNTSLFGQLRGFLADIAAEVGDRVKKKELAITELPANIYGFNPDQDGVDDAEPEQPEQSGEEDGTA